MNREILFPTPVYFKMVKDPQKMNPKKKEKRAGVYRFLLTLFK